MLDFREDGHWVLGHKPRWVVAEVTGATGCGKHVSSEVRFGET